MGRRDSTDSVPTSPRSPITTASILGHINSLTNSLQRRLSIDRPLPIIHEPPPTRPTHRTRPSHESDLPLTPIALEGFSSSTTERVLTPYFADEIRLMMPVRLQLYDKWDLVYSLDQHGVSLATLYARSKAYNSPQAGFVVIVKDR